MTSSKPSDQLLAPFSQEAEEAVIGSVLISGLDVFGPLQGILQMGDFYLTRHRHMWVAFQELTARGLVIDLTTVSERLREMGVLEEIGNYGYIIQLINNTPNSMHAESYAHLVQRAATRRKLLLAADVIRDAAMDENMNIGEVVAVSEDAVITAANSALTLKPLIEMSDAVRDYKADIRASIEAYKTNPFYTIGVRTGLKALDIHLDGLRSGITTVAGATGMGKTSFVGTVTLNASRWGILRTKEARPAQTVLFSGEMTQKQIMNRLVSSKTGVPVRNIERGNLSTDEMNQIAAALTDLEANHKLSFESVKRLNTTQIRQRVRSLVAHRELDLLVLDGLLQIDDLQYEQGSTKRQHKYTDAKRRDAIENIMNDLEDIGLTYDLPIVLTHQVSRAPSSRADKRPILSDLAEASFVEQKSAVILFLYRDVYYNPDTVDPNVAEIIAAKNRHGEPGMTLAFYNKQYTRFENLEAIGAD
jgi:replicative DNA helicase